MRIPSSPTIRIAAGLLLAILLGFVGYQVFRRRNPNAPEALLKRADEMAWLNNWIGAAPLYRRAEIQFTQQHQLSKALYARVSQIPAHSESSTTFPEQIAVLPCDPEWLSLRPSGAMVGQSSRIHFDALSLIATSRRTGGKNGEG